MNETKKLGRRFKILLFVLKIFQKILVPLERLLFPLFVLLFRFRGISYIAVVRDKAKPEKVEESLAQLHEIFCNAIEIKLALGEMGHRLMQSPEILDGIKYAYEHNDASIEIVHGPRVDPKTTTIFDDYAPKDIVSMYRMSTYARHHFIIVTGVNGTESLIDEGTHNETLWGYNKDGLPDEIFTSKLRFYYFSKKSTAIIRARRLQFSQRKQAAIQIKQHPGLNPPQDHTTSSYILQVLSNLLIKHLKQPFSFLFNIPLDLTGNSHYKVHREQLIGTTGQMSRAENGTLSSFERPSRSKEEITINISKIDFKGNPKHREVACGCGGQLTYQASPLSSRWNGKYLQVEEVWGWRCDSCSMVLLLPEVSATIKQHIKEAVESNVPTES